MKELGIKFVVGVMISIVIIFIILLLFGSSMYMLLSYGYVLENIWPWFIPESITSFKPDYWQSVGILFIIGLFNQRVTKKNEKNSKFNELKKNFGKSDLKKCIQDTPKIKKLLIELFSILLRPWFYLLFAWVIKNRFFL